MIRASYTALGFLCALIAHSTGLAQEAPTPPPSTTIVMTPPAPSGYHAYQQERLDFWKEKSDRARTGLVATSVTFAASWIFIGAAISQCEETFSGGFRCNDTGDALGVTGALLFWGGAIGMITTGVLLGVRNKRIREVQDEMQRVQHGFRWDPMTARFVF